MLVKGTQIYNDKRAISPWFARHWSQHCPKGHGTFINGHTIDNFYHQLPLGITTHTNNSYMWNIRFVCSIFLYLVYEISYKNATYLWGATYFMKNWLHHWLYLHISYGTFLCMSWMKVSFTYVHKCTMSLQQSKLNCSKWMEKNVYFYSSLKR